MSTVRPEIESHLDTSMEEYMASEKVKWDTLNAYWEKEFAGTKAYIQHHFAKYRAAFVGDTNSVRIPDPDQPEMHALTGDSMSPEARKWWRENKGKNLKDVMPELWEEMTEESEGFAEALRSCGVKVIRNNDLEYPEGIVNYNAAYRGPQFLSIYGGTAMARIFENLWVHHWEAGPVRPWPIAIRAGQMQLFRDNPDLRFAAMPAPEPDVNLRGPGTPSVDPAATKLFPGKRVLYGYGIPDAKHIPSTYDPKTCNDYTSAGNPVGGKFMGERILADHGFTYEEVFFDSKISYHFDCFLVMIKEGLVGLPEIPGHGLFGGLPDCLKDYEILPIPVEDMKYGVGNSVTIGDGRIIVDSRATTTMERMSKRGIDPIPVKYSACWDAFNSGFDCSDGEIWREND